MRILHTSDLHLQGSRHRRLLRLLAGAEFDVWVDTGDFAREPRAITIGDQGVRKHQRTWWRSKRLARRIAEALAGRAAIMIPGNHDRYVATGELLDAGVTLLRDPGAEIDSAGAALPRVTVEGVVFAGTRAIAAADGFWPGELGVGDAARLWSALPGVDVLLTHGAGAVFGEPPSPTAGIHAPLPGLDEALAAHGVPLHLHGHVHATGGRWQRTGVDGPVVVNAATRPMLIEWPTLAVSPVEW